MLSRGPLAGLRVLDLSRILAGPYATMMLADMGADVIKVERPRVGDDTRSWGPPFTKSGHESAYFLSINRNKRSIAIDLKHEKGLNLVTDLACRSDIVIDNFAPGDGEKLGLVREKFLEDFPSLIWCSITGYGRDGPLSHRLGYAVLLEAHSGLMNCTGPRDGDPVKAGVAMTDILTGLHACTGILAALHERKITGKGSLVDCSLLESQVSAMSNVASNWLIGNQESQRLGTDHPSIVPYGTVKTKDGRIAIAAGNDAQFRGLCKCLNIEYANEFKTNADRVKNRVACIDSIEKVTRTRTTAEWIERFEKVQEGKFAFAPVNNMQQVFSDPQVLHRKMVVECEHKTAGKICLPGTPIKFPLRDQSETVRLPPPVLGEHTIPVLQEVLGYDAKKIQNLIDENVVFPNVVTMETPVHVQSWIDSNRPSFSPPIGNKLMYKNLLSVMFVGGPNSRRDFHVDESSEFFYQIKGNMQLPIIERGQRKVVHIREGEVFLLPSRIPHSPQRPEEGSVGLVIERARDIPHEYDCMRWYTDFDTCEKIEFEKFFHCTDLGRDLVPVAREYEERKLGGILEDFTAGEKKILDDTESVVPEPFRLSEWVKERHDLFRDGARMELFSDDHPCKELNIVMSSLERERVSAARYEVFVLQIKGTAVLNQLDTFSGLPNKTQLDEGACYVLPVESEWEINRGQGNITMIVHCNPLGNKV